MARKIIKIEAKPTPGGAGRILAADAGKMV
jgi:hypothetical protein